MHPHWRRSRPKIGVSSFFVRLIAMLHGMSRMPRRQQCAAALRLVFRGLALRRRPPISVLAQFLKQPDPRRGDVGLSPLMPKPCREPMGHDGSSIIRRRASPTQPARSSSSARPGIVVGRDNLNVQVATPRVLLVDRADVSDGVSSCAAVQCKSNQSSPGFT